MSTNDLLSRDEIISGLPAKRASTLLFLIESRTALLAAKSRREMEKFLTENADKERDMAYLEAFTAGKPPPSKPTIQEIERFSPQWADLVPENPKIRASLAHALAAKYTFPKNQIPRLRRALGLDSFTVIQAYQELYHQPLDSVYTARVPILGGLSWAWTGYHKRLETANPFWTAFALTLTETVGAGILALPIVVAGIGPLVGITLLLILGLVNMLTVAAMAESTTRSLQVRYGRAYFGLMVNKYLGSVGSTIITGALAIFFIVVLFAYYYGFSTTLTGVTHIPATIWAAGLFIVCIYYVKQETLNATVASALVVGAISISLILIISILSAPFVHLQNLTYLNLRSLQKPYLNLSPIGIVIGVILAAYFGHTSVGNCARVVLQRDPGGRSLIWGSMAGQLAAMVIYIIWVLVVNGAVGPQGLTNQSGTAIVPLASTVGPIINILGLIYVIFAIGMTSIHNSLGFYNLVRERLPQSGLWTKSMRSLSSIIPLVGIFFLSERTLLNHTGSFSQPLGFLGNIVISLIAGVFPILLLVSSRKKGEIQPGYTLPGLNMPVIPAAVYLIFVGNLFMHGFLVWRNTFQGAMALLAGCLSIGITIIFIQRGAFLPRLFLELRSDANSPEKTNFSISSSGVPIAAEVQVESPENHQSICASQGEISTLKNGQSASFQIPPTNAWDLEVLAFRLGKDASYESLPGCLEIQTTGRAESFDLNSLKEEALTIIHGKACKIVYSSTQTPTGESYAAI